MKSLETIIKEKKELDRNKKLLESEASKKSRELFEKWKKEKLPEVINDELVKCNKKIQEAIHKLTKYSSSHDCQVSYLLKDGYYQYSGEVMEALCEALKNAGYKAKTYINSGGKNYDSDGIPNDYWYSYSVYIDLTPIKKMLFD